MGAHAATPADGRTNDAISPAPTSTGSSATRTPQPRPADCAQVRTARTSASPASSINDAAIKAVTSDCAI